MLCSALSLLGINRSFKISVNLSRSFLYIIVPVSYEKPYMALTPRLCLYTLFKISKTKMMLNVKTTVKDYGNFATVTWAPENYENY